MVTGCVSISAFSSFVDIYIGTISSTEGLRSCAITGEIKKCKSITKNKKKRHEKILLLAKINFNTTEVVIYMTLMNSYISHNKFMLVNVLKEYDYMKEEIKNTNNR